MKKILKIRLLLLVLCFQSTNFYLISQNGTFNCIAPAGPAYSPASCTPGSLKCVKVLFHFLNNTSNPNPNSPSDETFRKLLEELNLFFEPGNIHLSFGPKCIFKGNVTNVTNDAEFVQKFFNNNVFDPDPEMGWENDYMNVYFFQQSIFSGGVARGNWSCHSVMDPKILAHELGHMLGLIHTFGPVNGGSLLQESKWECKDRNESGSNGCATAGDKLCDTGADPYAMDLDKDGDPDQSQWLTICQQNISNNVLDICGNNSAWDIPVSNIMSQYNGCLSQFTPCQFRIMHDMLENTNNSAKFVFDCNDDPYKIVSCPDITINIPTTWTNQIVEMCPMQRIIITATGSLTLVNTKITKKVANPNCPGLSGNWDGIHILASGPQISYPGGPSLPSGGFIKVTSNSIIEFSDNGIQAPNSHLGITVENSIMRENGMAIYAKGPGGAVLATGVSIINSQISNSGVDAKPIMVYMNGSNITINSSTFKNNGGFSITGLKSYNAHVNVKNNTTIDGFGLGIDKELNGGLGIGLNIQNSKIINGTNSIRNTSSGVSATKNFFGGYVNSFGKAYGKWHANNFRKQVRIEDPSLSHSFTENNFKEELQLNKNQGLTDARCNTWDNSGQAVFGQASVVKSEWGTNTTPSGNIWKSQKPYMEIYQCNLIINWEKDGDEKTYFEYAGQFVKDKRINAAYACSHNLFPTSFGGAGGGADGSPYDDQTNRNLWTMYHNQYNAAVIAIANAAPTEMAGLISQRENAEVGMGQCVLAAWEQQMNSTIGLEGFTYWQSKTDAIVAEMAVMIPLLDAKDFSTLNAYLSTQSLQGDESLDRNIMISVGQWLANKMNENIDVLNLNSSDLNYLISLASSSFGNYTSLVRAFLNVHYNIHIDPPQYSSPRMRGIGSNVEHDLGVYTIKPNPSEDEISITRMDQKNGEFKLEIYSLDGKKWIDIKANTASKVNLKDKLDAGIYLIKISDQEMKNSQVAKLIIK